MNTDYLSELPEDILTTIISLLDIKDAFETRILSKRWRYVWTNHPDLKFNLLGLDMMVLREKWVDGDTLFVEFVDQIMEQRSKGIHKINSFCVQFPMLGGYFYQSIDKWISCAVRKGVESIDLDLYKFHDGICMAHRGGRFKRYNFSLLRNVSENKGSLKHLRLAYCNFRGCSSPKRFDSIVSLQFDDVNICDFQLNKVLESLPLLGKLVLSSCSKLTSFSMVHCNKTLLKTLSLKNLSISEIDLCGNNLISLELDELDNIRNFPLNSCTHMKTLALKNLFIGEIPFCGNNLISLELEHLYGISNSKLEKLMENCPVLEELSFRIGNLTLIDNLTRLKISDSSSTHLKVLSLECGPEISFEEIDICVNKLHTFEYIGDSRSVRFNMQAPRLVNAFILFERELYSSYHIIRKCLAKPMLENLVIYLACYIHFDQVVELLNDLSREYSNVKRLVLQNFKFHIHRLSWVSCIFVAFPMLQTLELNFESHLIERPWIEIEKDVEKWANGTVTRLEFNGFVGSQNQAYVLKYLLENLSGLQVLVIGPSHKVYKSMNCWVYSKVRIWNRGKESCQFDYEWVRTIIPPFVRLELRP